MWTCSAALHRRSVSSARLSASLTRRHAEEIITSRSFVWPLSSLLFFLMRNPCLPSGISFHEMFHLYSQTPKHVQSSEANTLRQLRNLQYSYLDLSRSHFFFFYPLMCMWVFLCLLRWWDPLRQGGQGCEIDGEGRGETVSASKTSLRTSKRRKRKWSGA